MTLQAVAKLAGVSTSTVSRVINGNPGVMPETVQLVTKAMGQLNFTPSRRGRRAAQKEPENHAATAHLKQRRGSFVFIIGASADRQFLPGFELLIRGVSAAAADYGMDMSIQFVTDANELKLTGRTKPDGLLMHGDPMRWSSDCALADIPSVWLMANRRQPAWGDHILPDNVAIGEIAANYLAARGHQRVAIFNALFQSWSMEVRAFAFQRTATARGLDANIIDAERHNGSPAHDNHDDANGRACSIASLVDKLLEPDNRPTGVFVAEDRQLVPFYMELRERGLRIGPDGDIDVISCNNERPYLNDLSPVPPTIDIHTESIGYRGVELLYTRLSNQGRGDRIRMMIDPTLIDHEGLPVQEPDHARNKTLKA